MNRACLSSQNNKKVWNRELEGSPYKSCGSYVQPKIVDIGPAFQKQLGPKSTTIRVQFVHLLENKGAIIKNPRSFDLYDFLYCQAPCYYSLGYWFRYWSVTFCHLRHYYHYDLPGDAKDLFNFIETVIIDCNLYSTISIFKDFE